MSGEQLSVHQHCAEEYRVSKVGVYGHATAVLRGRAGRVKRLFPAGVKPSIHSWCFLDRTGPLSILLDPDSAGIDL